MYAYNKQTQEFGTAEYSYLEKGYVFRSESGYSAFVACKYIDFDYWKY